jgi:hypothetical protein
MREETMAHQEGDTIERATVRLDLGVDWRALEDKA